MVNDVTHARAAVDEKHLTPNRPLHSMLRIRQDTAMPLYRQLQEQLCRLIEQGAILPGTTLPAERVLAEALGVSRTTVQQCYHGLREMKLLVGRGRHGSVVQPAPHKIAPGMDRLRGFTQEMQRFGRRSSSRVLEHGVVADRSVASLFGLPSTARFLRLVRVRMGDDVPLSVESAWYSLDAAPGLEYADPYGSIYGQIA
jgi:GntR family transcriptional regulator